MITTTLADDLGFPEAPRWHEGRLWFSDFHDRRVRALGPDGALETVLELDDAPSGLGWTPDGTLLVVAMARRALLEVTARRARSGRDLTGLTKVRANDLVVDAGGRRVRQQLRLRPAGGAPRRRRRCWSGSSPTARRAWRPRTCVFPNGMALTEDGRTLVVAETYGARLTAFDVDAAGALSGRRVFAETPGLAPDGICLDAEGHVWFATARTAEVVRVREGGEVTGRVEVGSGSLSYACALGGAGRPDPVRVHRATWREGGPRAGRIEVAQVDVPRAGRP